MILIIGGYAQGKREYAQQNFGDNPVIDGLEKKIRYRLQELSDKSDDEIVDTIYDEIIFGHMYQRHVANSAEPENGHRCQRHVANSADPENGHRYRSHVANSAELVIICDEIGNGIVPMEREDRRWRDITGRVLIKLAQDASKVIRVSCGIGQVIKDTCDHQTTHVVMIRHGQTAGNLEKRYIGRTDEDLCLEGVACINNHTYPEADMILVSPMKRCMQTAELIYPGREMVIVPDFRETDFGRFEGKNYAELSADPDYQAFIDSNGKAPFPDGESMEIASSRQVKAFRDMIDKIGSHRSVAIVAHGGTIMAILKSLFGGEYYDYQVRNGEGYSFDLSSDRLCTGLCARSFDR